MVDQMSERSFPASDPPAVWTWEVAHREPSAAVKPHPDREMNSPTIAPYTTWTNTVTSRVEGP